MMIRGSIIPPKLSSRGRGRSSPWHVRKNRETKPHRPRSTKYQKSWPLASPCRCRSLESGCALRVGVRHEGGHASSGAACYHRLHDLTMNRWSLSCACVFCLSFGFSTIGGFVGSCLSPTDADSSSEESDSYSESEARPATFAVGENGLRPWCGPGCGCAFASSPKGPRS